MRRLMYVPLVFCVLFSLVFVSSAGAAPASSGTSVIFYQDANYGGTASGGKAAGDYASLPGDVPNDWMSSLKVPSGWSVDAYADGNFGGAVCSYTVDTSWVGSACNDVMSSFKIHAPVSGWTSCASENGTCSFSGTQQVRYGSGSFYSTRTATGSIACNNATFGDPNFGVAKSCDYRSTVGSGSFSPSGWTQCAGENGTCSASGQVVYGGNGWFSQRNSSGSIGCNNATFGDPIPGTVKACYTQASTGGSVNYNAAPYVMPRDNNPPDIAAVMSASGVKAFTLAFILANGSSCSPAWDGNDPISSDTQVQAYINTIRANGGDVVPSVGGYGGTKLGQVCADGPSTYNAYNQVVTKYNIKAIDFDIEEPEIENAAAVARELYAAKQFVGQGLNVSVTMPVTTSGLNYFAMCSPNNTGSVLSWAQANNFTPTSWNVMPFDGGFAAPMGTSTVNIAETVHGQLKTCFGWDDATAYAHSGLSLMNGRSDTGEYTYQSDFTTIINYAHSHGLKRLTYWSVNRDRSCLAVYGTTDPGTKGDCSSVTQSPWDFTKLFAGF